ncbi:histidine kinase dimerization/phosphoacceptor domain -containing protein [Microvirga sp. W0021]|uniref:histidine kinase n=1 Tax=Hohaiivirga grylli TaxID=3133970 RepID=A0ABV0BKL9_9HYPH
MAAETKEPEDLLESQSNLNDAVAEKDWLRRLYIVATCIFTTTVPLILIAGLWIWTAMSESKQEIENYIVVRAVQVTHEVDAVITEQYSILRAIASLPSLKSGNLSVFQRNITNMKGYMPQWKVVALFDTSGKTVILDTLGNTNQPSTPGLAKWVRRVVETGEATVCTCYIKEDTDDVKHGVHVYVPVYQEGQVKYVLSATIRYDTIQRLITAAAAPYYEIGIVDENDAVIAISDVSLNLRGKEQELRLSQKPNDQMIGSFSGDALQGSVKKGAFSRSNVTRWGVITGVGADSANSLSSQSGWALLATGALSLILAAILAIMVIYNMVLRRIGTERETASQAVGELQARLLTKTREALDEQSRAASEREVLLRELYHRVKNNLQIIQSLLRLGSRDLTPEQREPFETAVRRIGAMARVHTLLYNSPDLASIDLKDYLASIVSETSEGFGAEARGISTRLDAETMRVPLDSAIPIAFIAIELLANAFKHAFPDGREGEISIVARRIEDGQGLLIISDNGVGIPVPAEKKRKPLGLNLVGKLVDQIGGQMVPPTVGTSEYRITFPLMVQDNEE